MLLWTLIRVIRQLWYDWTDPSLYVKDARTLARLRQLPTEWWREL